MPPETEQSRWFALEVLPNEPALRAYLRSRFPALPDLDDVVQETYRRLFRERAAGRLRHARAFMFTAARNVALDFFRHARPADQATITHFDAETVFVDEPNAAEAVSRQQERDLLAEAVRMLPERCRQVILLRYARGHSYQEIADRLGISTETVKTQMAKGLKRCAEYCAARGLTSPFPESPAP